MSTRKRKGLKLSTEGGADQSHAADTNINSIMAKYVSTGGVTHLNAKEPLYGDFSNGESLHTHINRVREAEATFGLLPANVRSAAHNDPVRFIDMVNDTDGRELLEAAGMTFGEPEEPSPAPTIPPSQAITAPDGDLPPVVETTPGT